MGRFAAARCAAGWFGSWSSWLGSWSRRHDGGSRLYRCLSKTAMVDIGMRSVMREIGDVRSGPGKLRTQKTPLRLPPWRSGRVRWVVVSGSALRHLRSTGTLLPCSGHTEATTRNDGDCDEVAAQHVALRCCIGATGVAACVDRSVPGMKPILRHPMGRSRRCQYPNRDRSMVPASHSAGRAGRRCMNSGARSSRPPD